MCPPPPPCALCALVVSYQSGCGVPFVVFNAASRLFLQKGAAVWVESAAAPLPQAALWASVRVQVPTGGSAWRRPGPMLPLCTEHIMQPLCSIGLLLDLRWTWVSRCRSGSGDARVHARPSWPHTHTHTPPHTPPRTQPVPTLATTCCCPFEQLSMLGSQP